MSIACRVLASVRNAHEAALVWPWVDLVDAKQPAEGALGALDAATLRDIVRTVAGRRPVSATVGDLPLQAALLAPAMQAVADTGVDFVKVGLFGSADVPRLTTCLRDLPTLHAAPGRPAPPARIAVLMADQGGVHWPLHLLAEAGFAGVMLDTADKHCGGLLAVLDLDALRHFVEQARALGLLSGLAGSLAVQDIPTLLPCQPDYLGFRTALCTGGVRTEAVDAAQVAAVTAVVRQAR